MKFEDIVGQKRAVAQAKVITEAALRDDGPNRPCGILGASGLGKSMIAGVMADVFRRAGWEVHTIASGGVIGTCSALENEVLPFLTSPHKTALFIDEAQSLFNGQAGVSPIVNKAFRDMVMPHGGDVQPMVSVKSANDEIHTINFHDKFLCFMTNEATSLESRASKAQNEYPIARRLDKISLDLYKPEEMEQIIPVFLARYGLRAHESSRKLIHGMGGRGTMEQLKELVDKYKGMFPDSSMMERGRVLEAARLTSFLPGGLKRPEGKLLATLDGMTEGKARVSHIAAMVGMKTSDARDAQAYLMTQKMDGKPNPYIDIKGSEIRITPAGRKYVEQITKDNFILS